MISGQNHETVPEQSLAAELRPLLTDVPIGQFVRRSRIGDQDVENDLSDIDVVPEGTEIEINVPLRNVRRGLALLGGPTIDIGLPLLAGDPSRSKQQFRRGR